MTVGAGSGAGAATIPARPSVVVLLLLLSVLLLVLLVREEASSAGLSSDCPRSCFTMDDAATGMRAKAWLLPLSPLSKA